MNHKSYTVELVKKGITISVLAVESDFNGNFCRWRVITPKRENLFFETKNQVKNWAKVYE